MMLLCVPIAHAQQKPLTENDLRQLLRESLDREELLNEKLDASTAHITSLENELKAAQAKDIADAAQVVSLKSQIASATEQINVLKDAVAMYKESIATYKESVAIRDKENTRLNTQLKKANKRTFISTAVAILEGAVLIILH
jgi:chromosome segregation ATPase